MINLLSYSGIVSKIHAMNAKLLSAENFQEIIQFTSVTALASYLKKQPAYENAFSDIDEHLLHRGDIEKILVQSLYNDYTKLYRFLGLNTRKYLLLYMKRYEVDLINYCFRIVFNHYEEPFDLNHKKLFFNNYSHISVDKLITSKNIEELVDNLAGTQYYEPLKIMRDSKASTLFDYNLALDLYYFSSIWKEKKHILKGKELQLFTIECGSKIDFLNLQWIYRAKKYYDMSTADIYSLLVPIHYRLKKDILKTLVETTNVNDYKATLLDTYYGKKYHVEDPLTLEAIYANFLDHLYKCDCRNHPYSIAAINKYLFSKEAEITKLTTALECIRYGLPPRETSKYVGGLMQ